MRLSALAAALVLALALVAGCGGGDSPEDAVQAYYDAATDEDAEAVCELLSAATIEEIEAHRLGLRDDASRRSASAACRTTSRSARSTEEGDTATVEVTARRRDEDVPLIKEDDEWKLDLAGHGGRGDATAPEESDQPSVEAAGR